jgi:cyanophycin synthetase
MDAEGTHNAEVEDASVREGRATEPVPSSASGVPRLRNLRALVGANLWRLSPVVVAEVVGGSADALARAIAVLPPTLASEATLADARPASEQPAEERWARALAALAIMLQQRAGAPVTWWTVVLGEDEDSRVIALEYEEGRVGTHSVRLAHTLLREAVSSASVDLDDAVAELSELNAREHFGPTTAVLVEAARRRGIPVRRAPGESVLQLGLGRRLHRIDATLTDRTSVIATDITSDKDRTKRVLARLGVPVPRGDVASSLDEALEIAEDIGFPLIVKPLDANNGRGTSPRLVDVDGMRAAYAHARAEHPQVVVERYVEGRDHRVLVVDGRVVAVSERVPAHVVGDGRRSIRALAEEINADPRRDHDDPAAPLAPLPLDTTTSEFLALSKKTLDTVPAQGEIVFLRSTANISTGGIPIDRTDEIHPRNAAICAFVADAVGLDVAGIDVLTPDISQPFDETDAAIIEVNASPGLRMHTEPEQGTPRDAPGAVIEMLFPPGTESRIPIVAVTGTNGKTTTTRLVAHIFRTAGRSVGFTTTDGVYFGEQLLYEGDMTGPMAADMVLSNPRVDVAVLETARGGILRSGLGFDGCDVSVVLNISADHLGLGGINTVDQLAAVKGVVVAVTRSSGAAVLNADDPLTYALRERTSAELVLFTPRALAESERTRTHVASGGRAVTVERGADAVERFVLHQGKSGTAVCEVASVPLTLGGAARFQVANAAAAAAAGWAAGLDAETIRRALTTFGSSTSTTPGRMNVLEVGGATIVIDYAHNVAAIEALLGYGERVKATRRIGAFGVPGDRRDDDIRAVGALGARLDFVVMKEHSHYMRGREPGEVAGLMRDGFIQAGGDAAQVALTDDEQEAVATILRMLRAGDLVLFLADDAPAVARAFGDAAIGTG